MRRWKARPFGGAVAQLRRRPHDVWRVLDRHLGDSECGRRVRHVLRHASLSGGKLAAPRKAPGVQAGIARVLLCVLSEMSTVTRCAAGPRLWQGERDRTTAPPDYDYRRWRIAGRRGMAARAGVSTRQLQRYLGALKAGGVLSTRQPWPEQTENWLRGDNHAYAVYQLLVDVPRAVAERLLSWRRPAELRARPKPLATPQPPPGEPYVPDWGDVLAGIAAARPPT